MDNYTQYFIRNHIDLIDNDNFTEFYKKLVNDVGYHNSSVSISTKVLLDAGINPLLFMDKVPPEYLMSTLITDIDIPNNIVEIGSHAFSDCYYLKDVKFPNHLEIIGSWAFNNCMALKNISLPASTKSLKECCFTSCDSFTEIVLPESITDIADRAFSFCLNLTSINIPKNVKTLGNLAFISCSKLREVTVESPDITDEMLKHADIDIDKVQIIRK